MWRKVTSRYNLLKPINAQLHFSSTKCFKMCFFHFNNFLKRYWKKIFRTYLGHIRYFTCNITFRLRRLHTFLAPSYVNHLQVQECTFQIIRRKFTVIFGGMYISTLKESIEIVQNYLILDVVLMSFKYWKNIRNIIYTQVLIIDMLLHIRANNSYHSYYQQILSRRYIRITLFLSTSNQ